ncbi:exosortase-dependent surface protein XDP1 [Alteromonas antoniana]|uniref:exosortase-dependent surface protein XDP1 n=1 Tax=Alteromonas antoniana TaxID=2803813 RepID=UPI001C48FEE9|nr:exosortase-dependent surface protein XDP1 [Alteromonas antoniana]
MKRFHAIALLTALTWTTSAIADPSTWDFTHGGSYSGGSWSNSYGNSLSYGSEDGSLSVSISAWADTDERSGHDGIETAAISENGYGLLNYNQNSYESNTDWNYSYSSGDWHLTRTKAADEHTIDNGGTESCTKFSYWSGGSYNCGNTQLNDTDFLLFEFSEAVSLAGINLGWPTNGTSSLSIGAIGGNSAPSISGSTWASVASGLMYKESFNHVGSSYSLASNSTNNISSTFSKYWLIGAYNTSFGSLLNAAGSSFKLAGLTTHGAPEVGEVSAPGTLAIFALGMSLLVMRRKKSAA